MRRFLVFAIAAVLLTVPAFAAEDADTSADPAVCAHYFEISVIREATCTEKGLLAYSCNKCGLTYTAETLPDGAHDYVLAETTATCTEDGQNTYVCSRCGDTYAEHAPATGHVPDDEPVSCTHSQHCSLCGEILSPATGHDYQYQYDAEKDENGDFVSYGTWKCANCGRTLTATEGNALYYYSLPEASASPAASDTDTAALADAGASGSDPSEDGGTAAPLPGEDAGTDSPDPQNGLWLAVSVIALIVIVGEAVLLVRSLSRKKVER